MDRHPDENDEVQFYEKLKNAIRYNFVQHVKPPSVMHIFHTIDPNVLNQTDMDRIRARQDKEGDMQGAVLLLELLCVYKNWFQCLLKVLRHKDVKLDHVADKFQRQYDKIYDEVYPSSNTCPNNDFMRQASNDGLKHDIEWKSPKSPSGDALNTFTLRDGLSSKPNLTSDGPMTTDESPSSPSASGEEPEGEPEKGGAEAREAKTKGKHGPEYDFTYEETSNALKDLPGWHKKTDEKKVEETLRKLCNEDGHFILWYWDRKKRPGVCVTFKKRIKTFIVHKRPAKQGNPVHFYIDRKGTVDPDLQALLSHHLDKGVSDMSSEGETIAFLHAVEDFD